MATEPNRKFISKNEQEQLLQEFYQILAHFHIFPKKMWFLLIFADVSKNKQNFRFFFVFKST